MGTLSQFGTMSSFVARLEGSELSWQDDLRQLDTALAAGQISADEYRTRRDLVLAQASGQQAPSAPAPEQPAPVAPQRPAEPAGDRTQFMPTQHVQPADPNADKTQVVPGRDESGDKTQIVPGDITGTPPPGFPPPQLPPPWETARPGQGRPVGPPLAPPPPPWANEEFPPEFGMPSWPRQGPEVFEESGGGGKGKVILLVVAIVVVLAGAVLTFVLLRSKDDNTGQQPPPTTGQQTSTPTSSAGPKLPKGPFVKLDGKEKDNKNIPMEEAVRGKVPTEQEAALLQTQGVSSVGMYVSTEGDLVRAVWGFTPAQGKDPKALLTVLGQYFTKGGHTEMSGVPAGVIGLTKPAQDSGTRTAFRAFYVADGVVLQIETYGSDEAAARKAFDKILADQVAAFPPTQ